MQFAHQIYQWLLAHPLYFWGGLSALLNLAREYKWLSRIEKTRWGLAVLDVVRALGIDPAGALRVVSLLVSSKAASLGATVLFPPSSSDGPPPTPRNTGDQP
jgi:hypothetical protein